MRYPVGVWPPMAGWMDESVGQLERTLVYRAFHDLGICETPLGSNRSGRIDAYNLDAGVTVGSAYCASTYGRWMRDCKCRVPAGYASCDNWLKFARRTGTLVKAPRIGYGILYGVGEDAQHIGLVIRVTPLLRTIENNTSISGFDPNGYGCEMKNVTDKMLKRVLGYIKPIPV